MLPLMCWRRSTTKQHCHVSLRQSLENLFAISSLFRFVSPGSIQLDQCTRRLGFLYSSIGTDSPCGLAMSLSILGGAWYEITPVLSLPTIHTRVEHGIKSCSDQSRSSGRITDAFEKIVYLCCLGWHYNENGLSWSELFRSDENCSPDNGE